MINRVGPGLLYDSMPQRPTPTKGADKWNTNGRINGRGYALPSQVERNTDAIPRAGPTKRRIPKQRLIDLE